MKKRKVIDMNKVFELGFWFNNRSELVNDKGEKLFKAASLNMYIDKAVKVKDDGVTVIETLAPIKFNEICFEGPVFEDEEPFRKVDFYATKDGKIGYAFGDEDIKEIII